MRAFRHTCNNSGTSPLKVNAPAGTAKVPNALAVRNASGQAVYVGGDNTVSASTGYLLANGETMAVDLVGDELWTYCASTGAEIQILARF